MKTSTPKKAWRNIAISVLGYGGDALCWLRAAFFAVVDAFHALDPDYARQVREEMDKKQY